MRHGLKKLLALVLGAMAFALAEGINLGKGIEQPVVAPAEQGEVALGFDTKFHLIHTQMRAEPPRSTMLWHRLPPFRVARTKNPLRICIYLRRNLV